jgi:hypothetical protein
MAQLQRFRSVNHGRRWRLAPPGENVDDDIGGMDALGQGLSAGGFDGGQAVAEHGGENFDHLPVAIVAASELTPDPLEIGRQHPILEWSPVPQSARLTGEDWHVMPGIVDCRAAAKGTGMVSDDTPILADDDAIGIGLDVDRTADGAGVDRIPIVIEAHQAGLRDRGLHFMETVEAAPIWYKLLPLFLKDVPDRFVGDLGVAMGLRVEDALVNEPGVHLVKALESQARREEALARQSDLVLDLPFFPTSGRRASNGERYYSECPGRMDAPRFEIVDVPEG